MFKCCAIQTPLAAVIKADGKGCSKVQSYKLVIHFLVFLFLLFLRR